MTVVTAAAAAQQHDVVVADNEYSVLTKKEILDELQLTDSKLETVEVMIEKEVQIRVELALLEADAAAKLKAAEEAIRNAKSVFNEANFMQEAMSGGNKKANNSAVYAIAQMIAIAENETIAENEPVEDKRADSVHEAPSTGENERKEISGDAPDSNVAIESTEQDDSEVVEEDLATSPSDDKAVDDAVDADEIDNDVEDIDESDDATSKTSNSSKKLEENKEVSEIPVDDESNDDNEEDIMISRTFSILTTASVSDDNKNDNSSVIEGTLRLLITKIDECRANLTDPNSSLEEQTDAAQMMTQFAKTAKALKKAV